MKSEIPENSGSSKMQLFRFREGVSFQAEAAAKPMEKEDIEVKAGLSLLLKSGFLDGISSTILFDAAGFSLARLQIKQGFRLPLHVHNVDCLYCIIGGSLRVGNEDLGVGDGFFVPAGVPYAITAQELGAEILEFRHSPVYDVTTRFLAKNSRYWENIARSILENRDKWSLDTAPAASASCVAD